MDGFCSVMSVIGLSTPQIGKEDDEDDRSYGNVKNGVHHTFILGTTVTSCCGTGTTT